MKRVMPLLIVLTVLLAMGAGPAYSRGGGGAGGAGGGGGRGFGGGSGGWQGGGAGWGQGHASSGGAHGGYGQPAPVRDICQGRPFSCQGLVVHEIGPHEGQGMVLLSEGRTITIYGIGPQRFWQEMQLDRPRLGQNLAVQGYAVDYNGVERLIATRMVIGGREINLRRAEDCAPVWQAPVRP